MRFIANRYTDVLIVLNLNGDLNEIYLDIYPRSLVLKKTSDNGLMAGYLDLKILLSNKVQI